FERLDMDVRGVLPHRFGEQRVDQADDRRVVVAVEQVFRLGQRVGQGVEVRRTVDVGGNTEGTVTTALVELAQQALEAGLVMRFQGQRPCGETAQLGDDRRLHAGAV